MLKPGLAIAGCLLLAGGIWWMQNRTPPAVTKKTGSVKQTTGKLQRAPAAASAPSEGSAFERE
jgi:hypothetical protein